MILKKIQPSFWFSKKIVSYLLWPFSYLYYFGFLADKEFRKKFKYDLRVIGVGNVTVGGGGKTPFAIWLYNNLLSGENCCFVCKGYLGVIKEPTLVTPNHTAAEVGDEAILLSRIAPTIVSNRKHKGVALAHKLGFKTVIVDDALQHHNLICDRYYLVVDGHSGFGNGFMLPAGPLRQPLETLLPKVDMVVQIGGDVDIIPITNLVRLKAELSLSAPVNNSLLAFSGIANPYKFFDLLKVNGHKVIGEKIFPDHHYYNKEDLDKLVKDAQKLGAKLITTEKDMVKIPNNYHDQIIVGKINLI